MKNKSDGNQSKNSWLQYVTEQSWEPELLISGLAIYATLNMPDLFRNAYEYYQYNLQAGSGILDELLPLLIFAVFTSVAYILMVAFITHFVLRAFWVGFIGLMSVYKGIKYDDLPYSEYYKQRAREELGSSENMANKLDQISSLIFSIAFLVVLFMVVVAFLYLIVFLLYNVLKLFIDPAVFETYISIMYYAVTSVALVYMAAIYIMNLKRFRNSPKVAKWHFNLSWKLNAVLMPLLYKPIQYIQLTFLSNLSMRRFLAYYLFFFLVFMGTLMGVILKTLDADIFDTRNFFTTRSSTRHVELNEYFSTIKEDELVQSAAIENRVISSGRMNVFIPYPKQLDELFNKFCEPHAVPDSLESYTRRRLINEHNIRCAENFFSFSADDSVQLKGELMFAKLPQNSQEGFSSYVNIDPLNPGRHMLRINRKPVTKADSTRLEEGRRMRFETEIPFWIE